MKKILIVDDNMDFLRILSSALQKRFQTYESMGVADALKILESVTVDAVCSDFNMRDGTGLELLIKLRQKGVKVPFLLMSGDDDTRLRNEAQVLWSSIFVTLMANKIGGLQFGIYRNCQISSRVFHTAVAALPLTKANRSDFE